MTRFAIKGLLSRKLRTALTAIAIVLGVAMISGTFVLTDSIDQAFGKIFTDIRQGSDAVISGKSAFDTSESDAALTPTFDETLLPKVRQLSEVGQAEGSVSSETTHLIDQDGKVIQFGLGGAPNLGFSIANPQSPFNPLTLVSGHWPGPGEVVIDKETASKKHLEVGQNIGVQVQGPVETFRIAGIVQFSSGLTIGGATLAGFELATAQKLFRKEGRLDEIAVAAKPNVTPQQLVQAIRPILPSDAEVKTASAAGRVGLGRHELVHLLPARVPPRVRRHRAVRRARSSSRTRSRSRSPSARASSRRCARSAPHGDRFSARSSSRRSSSARSRRSSASSSGSSSRRCLFGLFDLVGFILPNTGLVFLTRSSVIAALAAGILVTLIASLRPAIRATRVPPIAAVREGSVLPPPKHRRLRGAGAVLMAVAGIAAIAYGIFAHGLGTKQVLTWMGIGTLLMFIGVSLFSSRLVRPLAGVLGWPATRTAGAAGLLARDNTRRNPQRTASTAAALMIGLTLVTLVATLASGIIASFSRSVNDLFVGDYAITAQNNFSPIPIDAAAAAAKAPGVTAIGNVRTGEVRVFGGNEFATAVDPGMAQVIEMTWKEGSQAVFSQLGSDGVFVDDGYAEEAQPASGLARRRSRSRTGTTKTFVVKGVFDPPSGGSPFGTVTISAAAWDREVPSPENLFSFVKMTVARPTTNQAALDEALKDVPEREGADERQVHRRARSGRSSRSSTSSTSCSRCP